MEPDPQRAVKGGKPGGTALYEGGACVALRVRWPDNVPAGAKQATPVVSVDIFPTIVDRAGGDPSKFVPLDGLSLKPLLASEGHIEREALFLERHYGFKGGNERHAIVLPPVAPILINLRTALNSVATRDMADDRPCVQWL